jgi:carbon-monoxide dehydrogenase iron sulfur subunit
MEMEIFLNPAKCTGCKTCELACSVEHSVSKTLFAAMSEERRPRKRVFVETDGELNYAMECRHCENAPCVNACMAGALVQDNETGLVLTREEKCVGCWMCVMACPYGVINRDSAAKLALKCDRCPESGYPQCVKSCPTGALSFVEVPEQTKKARKEFLYNFAIEKEA